MLGSDIGWLGCPSRVGRSAQARKPSRPSANSVLEKSGFLREGRLRRCILHPNLSDEPRDAYLYARTRPLHAHMQAQDVLSVLAALAARNTRVWVAGGWGIDALLGQQSRQHAES